MLSTMNGTRHVPLDALPYFDAAMRHMSFAAAAGELAVTPSAVSQRIKALEMALGVTLFERLPNGLQATQAARLYLLEIRPALGRMRAASARIASQGASRSADRKRPLSIDVLPALATVRLAPTLRRFRQCFPDVELRLTTSRDMSDPARDGFDCCIRYGPGDWPGVETILLSGEHIFPVCAPDVIRGRPPIETLSDLMQVPLIHDMMPMGWAEWLATLGGPEPTSDGPIFSDSALAQRAAVEGLGVALGRSLLVAPDLAAGNLIRLLGHDLPSPFSYWLVRPPGRSDELVDRFCDWLVEEVLTPNLDAAPAVSEQTR